MKSCRILSLSLLALLAACTSPTVPESGEVVVTADPSAVSVVEVGERKKQAPQIEVSSVVWLHNRQIVEIWIEGHAKPYRLNDRIAGTDLYLKSVRETEQRILIEFETVPGSK